MVVGQSALDHLLVQGDVVQTDTGLTGEVVDSMVAVLQQRPAER